MQRSILSAVLGLLLCVGLPASSAPPKDDKPTYIYADSPATLKGLKDITVDIDPLPKGFQIPSLAPDSIRVDVELKLKQNGFHIVSPADAQVTHVPIFNINLNGFKAINNLYVYNITLELQEDVSPQRTKNVIVTGAAVWQRAFVGATGELNISVVRNDIRDDVDTFINDYQAANTK